MAKNRLARAGRKLRYILTGRHKERPVTIEGTRFEVRLSDHIGKRMLLDGAYEPRETAYMIDLANRFPFDLFLDIGACFGLYSLILANNSKIPEIIAFEPNSDNRALLERHIALNGMGERIEVRPYGISDHDWRGTLITPKGGNIGGSLIQTDVTDYQQWDREERVELRTLDGALEVKGKKILIKMDVDFHEEQALTGARQLLRDNQVLIQLELSPEAMEATCRLLMELGLHLIHATRNNFYFTNSEAFFTAD